MSAKSFSSADWAYHLLNDDPARILIVSEGKRISAGSMSEEVSRIRSVMNLSGLAAENIVAISAERSVTSVAAILACFCENISPFLLDPRQDHEVLSKLCDAVRIHGLHCGTLLDSAGFKARLPDLKWVGESAAQITSSRTTVPDSTFEGSFILHTAGTCALPRAIQHGASAIQWQSNALANSLRLKNGVEIWFTGSLALSPGFALAFCSALSSGGSIVLDDPVTHLSQASRITEGQRILLLSQVSDSVTWTADKLLAVKGRVTGVMTTDTSLTESYAETVAQATDAPVWNGLSCTEAAGFLTINPIPGVWPAESVGRPIAGTELMIIGLDGNLLNVGELGRMCYQLAPTPTKITSLTFQTRPEPTSRGTLTGDWGRIDGSDYAFVQGCEKTVFYRAGFPILARSVEQSLQSINEIAESVVFGVPQEEIENDVAAVIIPKSSAIDLSVSLRSLEEALPRYLVPERVTILDSLSVTPTGKVKRFGLPIPAKVASAQPKESKQFESTVSPSASTEQEPENFQ